MTTVSIRVLASGQIYRLMHSEHSYEAKVMFRCYLSTSVNEFFPEVHIGTMYLRGRHIRCTYVPVFCRQLLTNKIRGILPQSAPVVFRA